MPTSQPHRSSAPLALLVIFAGLAFAWLQYVDSPRVASAAANSPSDASLAFAGLRPQVTPAPAPVTGAAPIGQFEPLVTPTAVPTAVPTATSAPTAAPTAEAEASLTPAHLLDSGIASTYGSGDGFEGRRTACGEIFHTSIVQVAHKTLPCGTLLRIEDPSTGRTVDAEVTDRGPYIPGRIVDLSWAAFSQLDAAGPGLLRVNIYLLDS